MCRERSEDNFASWRSPFTVWIPGHQAASTFTIEPSCLAGLQFLNMNFFLSSNCNPHCSMQLRSFFEFSSKQPLFFPMVGRIICSGIYAFSSVMTEETTSS